jgi:porphobilinogen synthase
MTLFRGHRLRKTETLRTLVREVSLQPHNLIFPLFITEGQGKVEPIASMPGQNRYSVDELERVVEPLMELGVRAVLLFGIVEKKDEHGSGSSLSDGVVQTATRRLKQRFPELCVITDVCLCEYTDHGHCGYVRRDGTIDNDRTLTRIAETALSQAEAGADIVAPSDMMDGRVAAIRNKLDARGLVDTPIMSYSAKFASAFYGPFRDAAGSTPQFGDRRCYQMDPANGREAMREIEADIAEGADLLIMKPAMAYMDVIARARDRFEVPMAAYNVSGEYSMVKMAAAQGLIDEKRMVMEILTGFRRAGCDLIITYHAPDVARWLSGKP